MTTYRFTEKKDDQEMSTKWVFINCPSATGMVDINEKTGRLERAAPYFRFLEGKTYAEFEKIAQEKKWKYEMYQEV